MPGVGAGTWPGPWGRLQRWPLDSVMRTVPLPAGFLTVPLGARICHTRVSVIAGALVRGGQGSPGPEPSRPVQGPSQTARHSLPTHPWRHGDIRTMPAPAPQQLQGRHARVRTSLNPGQPVRLRWPAPPAHRGCGPGQVMQVCHLRVTPPPPPGSVPNHRERG